MSRLEGSTEVWRRPDRPAQEWARRLQASSPERDAALRELHALLVRAASFEINRRRAMLPGLRPGDLADLARECADDALVALLAKLDQFRGESRFSTWAYKFALYEAAAKVRRRAWQARQVPVTEEALAQLASDTGGPQADAEMTELLRALHLGIERDLTPHQREVLVALAINETPIDVLAERLNTTRGALYKALHDARQRLRASLAAQGMSVDGRKREVTR